MSEWRPTKAHEARLLAGDYRPFTFEARPGCAAGTGFVFAWSRAKRHADEETGQVFDAPAAPAAWIKVTKVVRQTKHWVVHFDVFDKREPALMPAFGSGYTTDPRFALDKAQAVLTEKDQRRIAEDARAFRAAQQERSEEARRRQERAIRARLRNALRSLSPQAQVALMAKLEVDIAEAVGLEEAA